MRARKVKTEIRQDQIARAALSIVVSQGLEKLNVAAVAEKVGIVPSGIYRHFKGKEAVLDAVLDFISSRMHTNLTAVRNDIKDPLERLHALLQRHIQMIQQNRAIPQIIFSDEIFGGQPQKKEKLYGIIKGLLAGVGDVIQEGQERGHIRADMKPPTLALMFLGLIQPAAIIWHLSCGAFDIREHAEKAWKVYRDAIVVTHVSPKGKTPAERHMQVKGS